MEAFAPEVLESLTPSQREAVTHVDGPLLILAGPGSGKTRVVTHRIAHLLHEGVPPRQILALTFTNKAADEMRRRLTRLAPGQDVWMGTFHRFCARLLRRHASLVGLEPNFSIYDADDSRKALKAAMDAGRLELTHATPDGVAAAIGWAKNNLITADEYEPRPGHALGALAARAYPLYQQRLLASNAVDFDDLLLHVAVLLRENPELRASLDERWRYILVDEYQDTNLAQYTIVRAVSVRHPNLAVTGDPDQSIYGWRGANLSNILEFERDFPKVRVVRLEQNYRSTKSILRAADTLIGHNLKRKQKSLYTENPEGSPVRLVTYSTQREEAESIAGRIAAEVREQRRTPGDFAIFYRTNALSRSLEHALRDCGLPYQIVNGFAFYQRAEIKDVIAYLQVLNNPRNDLALLRIINTPARGIGKATLNKLAAYAREHGLSLLDAARRAGLVPGVGKRAAVSVAAFVAMYDRLGEVVDQPLEEVLGHVLTESGYQQQLIDSGTAEDEERLANIQELLTAAREFDEQTPEGGSLEAFLEQTSLVSDTDAWESASQAVTLMTLHAAKGLEFPVVYIVAVEENLLPHQRSKDDADQFEEERRLLFVGMTRAKEQLQLSLASRRAFRGSVGITVPSPFLMELPREEMEVVESGSAWVDDYQDDDSAYYQDSPDEEYFDTPPPARLQTAADMLRSKSADGGKVDPNRFTHGMTVVHPEYGPGKIVALSGRGLKRTATVNFAAAGQKKFRVMFSELKPK